MASRVPDISPYKQILVRDVLELRSLFPIILPFQRPPSRIRLFSFPFPKFVILSKPLPLPFPC